MDKKLTFFLRNDGRANGQTDGRSEAGVMMLRTVKYKKLYLFNKGRVFYRICTNNRPESPKLKRLFVKSLLGWPSIGSTLFY